MEVACVLPPLSRAGRRTCVGGAWHTQHVDADELVEYAKIAVGREHGLSAPQARRLVGSSLRELHADATTMAQELAIDDPYTPEPGQTRDGGGRFAAAGGNTGGDMNAIIRAASGRR